MNGERHFLGRNLHGACPVTGLAGDFRRVGSWPGGQAENDLSTGTDSDQGAQGEQEIGRQGGIGWSAHSADLNGGSEQSTVGEYRIESGWRGRTEEGDGIAVARALFGKGLPFRLTTFFDQPVGNRSLTTCRGRRRVSGCCARRNVRDLAQGRCRHCREGEHQGADRATQPPEHTGQLGGHWMVSNRRRPRKCARGSRSARSRNSRPFAA